MDQYHSLVKTVLSEGTYKPNKRTGVDTIAYFSPPHIRVDLRDGYPLLTTKKINTKPLFEELEWYLSGEHHIGMLKERNVKIWDLWADENNNLETAYGRFWRFFPVPSEGKLEGEAWATQDKSFVRRMPDGGLAVDQLGYVLESLKRDPSSRRNVVSAWHPANATVSRLPPCHMLYVFNVNDGHLHLNMTQRSADVAVGIPFNIAQYSAMLHLMSQLSGIPPGRFVQNIVDAHIYCGTAERGEFYGKHGKELQQRIQAAHSAEDYLSIKEWIVKDAPAERAGFENFDHVPGLLTQLSRQPKPLPTLRASATSLDDVTAQSFQVEGYQCDPFIKFSVAQ